MILTNLITAESWITPKITNRKKVGGDEQKVRNPKQDSTLDMSPVLLCPLHRGLFVVLGVQNFLATHGANSWKTQR